MSVNLTALLERVAALEARDGDSLVTVEDCGPGFPDYGENATSPEGLNTCVLVYSTVWFWLGAACFIGPSLLLVIIWAFELLWKLRGGCGDPGDEDGMPSYTKMFSKMNDKLWTSIFRYLGPSTLLFGGYQRDYHVAGYVLVGLSFLLLVCKMLTKFCGFLKLLNTPAGRSIKANRGKGVDKKETKSKATKSTAEPAASEPAAAVRERKARSVYSDLGTPFLLVLVYGAAQIMLVGFYIYSLYTNGRPDFTNTDTYIFYFAGCLFQIILFSKHQGEDAGILVWASKGRLFFKNDKLVVVDHWQILLRQVLDIAINMCASNVIYISLPLQLAGTSTTYFDFMLNSCATAFILELDDKEGRTYVLKTRAELDAELHKVQQESRTTAVTVSDQESAAKLELSANRAMASSSDPVAEEHV